MYILIALVNKGVLTGKLNGEDAVYDVTVTDAGSDFDIDWELRM